MDTACDKSQLEAFVVNKDGATHQQRAIWSYRHRCRPARRVKKQFNDFLPSDKSGYFKCAGF